MSDEVINAIGYSVVLAGFAVLLGTAWFLIKRTFPLKAPAAYLASCAWLFVTGLMANEARGFNVGAFFLFGILPVAAYWGYRTLKKA